MASLDKIKEIISGIAVRRKNTSFNEIGWVMDQLKQFYDVDSRKTRHGVLFRVGDRRFSVCTHNPGSGQVKAVYVDEFIDAMTDLGLYDD
jgi:hypothetical protein